MTVKDYFNTIGKEFHLDCATKLNMMNDVLDLLWIDTYELKTNQDIIPISGEGIQTLTASKPIYNVDAFYVRKSSCSAGFLQDLDNSCIGCADACSPSVKMLTMYEVGAWDTLETCQYMYCRDGKDIQFNIPAIESGFIKYYTGFERLTALEDCIPVQSSLLPAVKMLMKVYYYEKAGTVYDGDDGKFLQRYQQYIQKMLDRDASKIRYVKGSQFI